MGYIGVTLVVNWGYIRAIYGSYYGYVGVIFVVYNGYIRTMYRFLGLY